MRLENAYVAMDSEGKEKKFQISAHQVQLWLTRAWWGLANERLDVVAEEHEPRVA